MSVVGSCDSFFPEESRAVDNSYFFFIPDLLTTERDVRCIEMYVICVEALYYFRFESSLAILPEENEPKPKGR